MHPLARRVGLVGRAAGILALTSPLVFAALLLAAAIAGAPPEHDIVPPNAVPVSYRVAQLSTPTDVYGDPSRRLPAPSTSIDDLRCAAWHVLMNRSCPASLTLGQRYWPSVAQQPNTIYVGVVCITAPPHLNVEYGGGVITLHCHQADSWYHGGGPHSDNTSTPMLDLLLLPSTDIPHGHVRVVEEVRVERWLLDSVQTTHLGAVTIS